MTNFDVAFVPNQGETVVIKVTATTSTAAVRTALNAAERDKLITADTDDLLIHVQKTI